MLGFESECAFLDIQASQNLAGFTLYFISFVYCPVCETGFSLPSKFGAKLPHF